MKETKMKLHDLKRKIYPDVRASCKPMCQTEDYIRHEAR